LDGRGRLGLSSKSKQADVKSGVAIVFRTMVTVTMLLLLLSLEEIARRARKNGLKGHMDDINDNVVDRPIVACTVRQQSGRLRGRPKDTTIEELGGR
jgi:hypothetical protein